MKISKDETKHIAHLSRLTLSEKELTKFSEQLSDILGFMEKLSQVKTDGIKPVAQITGLENIWRQDLVRPCQIKKEDLLKNAPKQKDGFIKVKAILE